MGYNTQTTEWPSSVSSPALNDLIDRLFNTLDSSEPDAGDRLADVIFSQDGKMKLGGKWIVGPDAIRRCRDSVWKTVATRQHIITKVYTSQPDTADDLLLLGSNTVQLRNGKTVQFDLAARLRIDQADVQNPRIASCESWADSAPMTKALQSE